MTTQALLQFMANVSQLITQALVVDDCGSSCGWGAGCTVPAGSGRFLRTQPSCRRRRAARIVAECSAWRALHCIPGRAIIALIHGKPKTPIAGTDREERDVQNRGCGFGAVLRAGHRQF